VQLDFIPRSETKLNKSTLASHFAKGQVPAAVYGKSIDAGICFVSIKGGQSWHRGSMFDVSWQGQSYTASIGEIQYHPVKHTINHVSFHLVGKNEVTHIEIPVHMTGQSVGEKAGGMVSLQRETLTLKGKASDMPEFIEVDVSSLDVNAKITLADLTCPPNTEWYHAESDWTIVSCAHVKVQAIEEAAPDAELASETEASTEAVVEEKVAA
jgi:large subunit ribosomal protein L25